MTVTGTDLTVIEALDFALPCDVSMGGDPEEDCPDPAAWVITLRDHHPLRRRTFSLLICQKHYEFFTNGGMGFCSNCHKFYEVRLFIVRLEPLRPPNGDSQ